MVPGHHLIGAPVQRPHLPAALHQCFRHGAADAAGGAEHQCDLLFHDVHSFKKML
jgi:hypothetical protein